MLDNLKSAIASSSLIKLLSIPIYIFRIFPINTKKILCWNFAGTKGYGDSPKYIVEELSRRAPDTYTIIWIVKSLKANSFPKYITPIKKYSIKYFYHIATSKFWILNTRSEEYFIKRKQQFYIQTWHSGLRLKKIEGDAIEQLPKYYVKNAKRDSKMIDILICGSSFSKQIYERAFWYSGTIVMTGTPRYDEYFDKKKFIAKGKETKQKLHIDKFDNVILYAPTFRKNNPNFNGKLDYGKINETLKTLNAVLLVKFHPGSSATIQEFSHIKDVSRRDLQELISMSDLFITDYSGCCFDALLAKKPCVLYTPDLQDYLRNERELYFNYVNLPFAKIDNQNSLESIIKTKNYKKLTKRYCEFRKKIGSIEDGHASERTAKIILKENSKKMEQQEHQSRRAPCLV
ncbi:CDP-glycerol glycerophosphotransferase family protein [Candidatus Saccharibacteria bacterium]|nr:CDP-glycerol glycerophosphotransferase family protein [Candidatus Saccharibacteria bacterium]